jgi:hypothetical protein
MGPIPGLRNLSGRWTNQAEPAILIWFYAHLWSRTLYGTIHSECAPCASTFAPSLISWSRRLAVRMPPSHGGDQGFESPRDYQRKATKQLVAFLCAMLRISNCQCVMLYAADMSYIWITPKDKIIMPLAMTAFIQNLALHLLNNSQMPKYASAKDTLSIKTLVMSVCGNDLLITVAIGLLKGKRPNIAKITITIV